MASILKKSNIHKDEDDEEDLEALRKAALMTLRKKPIQQHPPLPNVIFQPHMGNPNLIAIIPEGTDQQPIKPRQNYFRHPPPRNPQLRSQTTTLKVLPQVQIQDGLPATTENKGEDKEEVSTKFSRFEDTESESEDESETEKNESDSSDESEDVLAIEDDDDSLEALMAQMEHEIQVGMDPEPSKKEKKKLKSNKSKEKELKVREEKTEKVKLEAKTAVVEPTMKETVDVRVVAFEEKPNGQSAPSPCMREKSPVKIHPLKTSCTAINSVTTISQINKFPVRRPLTPTKQKLQSPPRQKSRTPPSLSPRRSHSSCKERSSSPSKRKSRTPPLSPRRPQPSIKQRSPSPSKHKSRTPPSFSPRRPKHSLKHRSPSPPKHKSRTPPLSPQRIRTPIRRVVKSRSPIKQRTRSRSPIRQRSCSPKRSIRSKSPRGPSPLRRKSPRNLSPDRRSPGRYYSGNKSPSPYYRERDRDYIPGNRSRSPIRRRSLTPRKGLKDPSPKYYQRRSRSPWSPAWRPSSTQRSPSPRYRSRSPIPRRSLSPRPRKYKYTPHSPSFASPKRRSVSLSPRRSRSPPRKRDYSPRRRQVSPRRELSYRRNSISPKRKISPPYKKYSSPSPPPPVHSPKHKQRSISPKRNVSPRRRPSTPVKESQPKAERRSRTPSLSLSPSPPRDAKESARRYKSPLRPRKEPTENVNNRTSRTRRGRSLDNKPSSGERKKITSKGWEREGRQWDKKVDDRRKEKADKSDRDSRRDRENRSDKHKREEPKEEAPLKVTDNPVFEARRRKFESTAIVEPIGKKIRLVTKKDSPSPNEEKPVVEEKKVQVTEEKKIVENSVQTEDDLFSGHEEIDEIDNFLNEDVLDLSAEVWSSDDELFPKSNKNTKAKPFKSPVRQADTKEPITAAKEKVEIRKSVVTASTSPPVTKPSSPATKKTKRCLEKEAERKDRDDSDLRAELSRRREERLTKAGSLHEKLPARLLQSAFESALGTKKSKKEEKSHKSEKGSKNKDTSPPVHKEKSDGRRVLVLKRPAPVRMQSAHINVTFPKDGGSDSETSYSSSSSDERYAVPAKRKLPVYMRLGTAQRKRSGGRKVKLRSRRNQV